MNVSVKLNLLFQLIFLLFSVSLPAQDAKKRLSDLKTLFPDEDMVVLHSTVDYSFNIQLSEPLVAEQKSSACFIALKSNAVAVYPQFYDAYSQIVKSKFVGSSLYKANGVQRCGDFERDNVFYHDAKVCEYLMKIEQPGDSLTLRTTKVYNDLRYFTHIPLHSSFSAKRIDISISIPDFVQLELVEMNFENFNITKSERMDEKEGVRYINYTVKNMPSGSLVDDDPDYNCTFPHLLVLVRSYEKEGKAFKLIESMDDLQKWYLTMIGDTAISPVLKAFTDKLAAGATSDEQKIKSVYYWVQDKIRYIAFENGLAAYKPDSPDKVFRNKYGDCKGMSNLVKGMLRYLGFDARICWVYSGNYCYPEGVASIGIHNHVICAVKTDTGFIYLDPTMNYLPLHEIPLSIQGKDCMIENGDNCLFEKIPPVTFESGLYRESSTVELDGDRLLMNGKIELAGSPRQSFQYFMNHTSSDKKEDLLNYLVKGASNNFTIQEIKNPAIDTIANSFVADYKMTISNAVIDAGDELLLNLDFNNNLRGSVIDSARLFPYDPGGIMLYVDQIDFEVPDYLLVKHLPEPVSVLEPGFEIAAAYALEGSLLKYRKRLAIKKDFLTKSEFAAWNKAIEQLSGFYNDLIILKKK